MQNNRKEQGEGNASPSSQGDLFQGKVIKAHERQENNRLPGPVTFGVYGVMEWVALIPAGRTVVRVHFTGGAMSGYGVTPATHTTTNRAVYSLIRRSHWYKCGRIVQIS